MTRDRRGREVPGSDESAPRLHPAQVCFVVDDVAAAVAECTSRFGWGPFHEFSAPVSDARYHGWRGAKRTDVALGMAGPVQVELIHVHEGHDTVEAYQARYGAGFQHLGIQCRDREDAIAALEALGAVVDDRMEYEGVRIAFLDTPTGPGMFELLHATAPPPGERPKASSAVAPAPPPDPAVTLDRATIVTRDLDRALAFYGVAFGWDDVAVETCSVRFGEKESRVRRVRGAAGRLLLELVEPGADGDDPYASHLARGDHGLVHAGGFARSGRLPDGAVIDGEWLEDAERFTLYDWSGGPSSLALRHVPN